MDIRQTRTRSLVSDVDVAVKTVKSVLTKREDS
jgi:lipopolysaccharide/colanic/teichoic acid biosynthesis glycosyltransferase